MMAEVWKVCYNNFLLFHSPIWLNFVGCSILQNFTYRHDDKVFNIVSSAYILTQKWSETHFFLLLKCAAWMFLKHIFHCCTNFCNIKFCVIMYEIFKTCTVAKEKVCRKIYLFRYFSHKLCVKICVETSMLNILQLFMLNENEHARMQILYSGADKKMRQNYKREQKIANQFMYLQEILHNLASSQTRVRIAQEKCRR